MALTDLIASGGRTNTSMSEKLMGLQKLQMQQEQLGLARQTTMSNLQTMKEKRAKDQQKTDLISSSQADALRAGGSPAEQEQFFTEILTQRAKQTGRLDVVKDLKDAYGTPRAQSKHERLSELARQKDRSSADEREFIALRGYQPAPAVKVGKRDIGHAQKFVEQLPYGDEIQNPKLFIEDLADRAQQIRADSRVRGGKGVSRGEAFIQAEQLLRESGNIKSRGLAIPFGQANYVYDPYGGGEGVTTMDQVGEDTDLDINDMEDEDTDDTVEATKPEELKEGESGVFGGREYKRVGGKVLRKK